MTEPEDDYDESLTLTYFVNVKTVDQGEVTAVECPRCAALVASEKRAKHDRVCTAVSIKDVAAAIDKAKRITQRHR